MGRRLVTIELEDECTNQGAEERAEADVANLKSDKHAEKCSRARKSEGEGDIKQEGSHGPSIGPK